MDNRRMYMSVDEVAEVMGCKKYYAYEMIKKVNRQMQDRYPDVIIPKGKVLRKYFMQCVNPMAADTETEAL